MTRWQAASKWRLHKADAVAELPEPPFLLDKPLKLAVRDH